MDHTMIPMLCTQSESAKGNQVATLERLMADLSRYSEERYALEAKFDGFRLVVERTEGGVRIFIGRNGSEYTDRIPLVERALLDALPSGTVVDGELIHKDGRGDVQSAIFTQQRYTSDDLAFVAFDVLRIGGQDARKQPWSERRQVLEGLEAAGRIDNDRLRVSTLLPTSPQSLKALVDNGFEGCVVKRRSSRYVNGRSSEWTKFKPQATLEARIVGFKPGKAGGAYDGKVGAFEIELLDSGVRTTVKCGNEDNHKSAHQHPELWRDHIIEIKYFSLGEDGVPLSPQFYRRRDDRTPDQTGRPKPSQSLSSPSTPDVPSSTGAVGSARSPRRPSGPKPRNYGAMKDAKLLRSIQELRDRAGEAFERAMALEGADDAYIKADLRRAEDIACARGLEVPA